MVPNSVWNSFTKEQKAIIQEASLNMATNFRTSWAAYEQQIVDQVSGKVEFITDVDKESFREACQPIYDNLDATVAAYVNRIEAVG